MPATVNYLAADIGASNGRVLLGQWDGERFQLQDLHRFRNGPVTVLGRVYTDILMLWSEVRNGLARYTAQFDAPVAGFGLDTWGVDCGLFDAAGRLLGNPAHYRDPRTGPMMERAFTIIPRAELYRRTGLQFIQFNTLFQIFTMRALGDSELDRAATMLMIPDIFHYWLTGEKIAEYTIASTTQMLSATDRQWAPDILERLDIPSHILPPIVQPGSIVGSMLPAVLQETGLRGPVPVIAAASHDTASAVAGIPFLDEHSIYISSGTWSLMGVETRTPVLNDTALALNFTNEGGIDGTIRLLKNITGLWLLQESRRQWEREGAEYTWPHLLALAEQAAPFKCIVNPDAPDFFEPSNMVDTIRAFCRRTGQPEPATVGEVVRCCLESLALRYRWVAEALEELLTSVDHVPGPRLHTIRVVGGGSQNRLLNQFTADACQRMVVSGPAEAAALGVVMVQAVATGHLGSFTEGRAAIAASSELDRFEPRRGADWDGAFARFVRMMEQ